MLFSVLSQPKEACGRIRERATSRHGVYLDIDASLPSESVVIDTPKFRTELSIAVVPGNRNSRTT